MVFSPDGRHAYVSEEVDIVAGGDPAVAVIDTMEALVTRITEPSDVVHLSPLALRREGAACTQGRKINCC
ncbi:hypothetical protein ABZV91_11955 [Nocardia sp. NPDC004568]|uniref:hypothetical protein n=1 Tax=Nocardia sp. NPDC004568 TaxID=3154551 RepID=UPI0033B8BC12